MVYQSLLHGRCYFALEYFRKAQGFRFLIEQDKHKFYMGDRLKLSGSAQLTVSFPEQTLVRIIRNGLEQTQKTTSSLSVHCC